MTTEPEREAGVTTPSLPPPLPREPRRSSTSFRLARSAESSAALRADSAPPGALQSERPARSERSDRSGTQRSEARLQALEQWRLDFGSGGPGAVRVSEFAEFTPLPAEEARREAYLRPANKRDLGHRCYHCRRPFSTLGSDIVTEIQGGPTQRFHPECWRERGRCVPSIQLTRRQASDVSDAGEVSARSTGGSTPLPSYAEEWRRAGLDHGSSSRPRPSSRGQSRRTPILDGVNAIEDANGEKKVARGFSMQEMEAALQMWSGPCDKPEEECAVCLLASSMPLQLPCGHVFCSECVEPWLRRCGLCPMCRSDLRPLLKRPPRACSLPRSGCGSTTSLGTVKLGLPQALPALSVFGRSRQRP